MPAAGKGAPPGWARRLRRLPGRLVRILRRHLSRSGVIAYPTESCFGLGCDPRDRRAVRRILRLKGRPQSRGLILIASDFGQLRPYVAQLSPWYLERLQQVWPGPVTFLLPAGPRAPRWVVGRHRLIAVRVTAHGGAAALCRSLGTALVSTSANRAGARPARTYADCWRRFGGSVRVVKGCVGRRRRPSTIMDLETGRILRS